jgi:hypothetical protein
MKNNIVLSMHFLQRYCGVINFENPRNKFQVVEFKI